MNPVPTQVTFVLCPACKERNLLGDDQCWNCLESLTGIGLPAYADESEPAELNRTLAALRLREPTILPSTATVREAVALLRGDPGGAVIVVEGGNLAGIFTERDVLHRVAGQASVLDQPLATVMTRDPVVLQIEDRMSVVLNKMGVGEFRHVPVLRDGSVVGLVTATDVMRWVLLQFFD